jgi:hypothetical protein
LGFTHQGYENHLPNGVILQVIIFAVTWIVLFEVKFVLMAGVNGRSPGIVDLFQLFRISNDLRFPEMEWKGPGFLKDEIKEPLHMCSKKSIEIYRNPHFAATLLIGFDAHISSRNRHKSTFRDWQVNFASVCSLKS